MIDLIDFRDKIQAIAKKHGIDNYKPILAKIIGEDYESIPMHQWADRARAAGYVVSDMDPILDALDLLFAQERQAIDKSN